jgi:hypothetical protein
MSLDTELDIWREQWQSATVVPPDLQRRVERQTRTMKLILIAEIFVTIGMGGVFTAWAVRTPEPDIVVLAVVTWIFLASAWWFSMRVNRGKWSPSALDTRAFLDLSISRCRGRLAALKFGAGLFVCEIAFCLGWLYHHLPVPRQPLLEWLFWSSMPLQLVWLFTVLFFGFLLWYRRRKRAELVYLLQLRGQAT